MNVVSGRAIEKVILFDLSSASLTQIKIVTHYDSVDSNKMILKFKTFLFITLNIFFFQHINSFTNVVITYETRIGKHLIIILIFLFFFSHHDFVTLLISGLFSLNSYAAFSFGEICKSWYN